MARKDLLSNLGQRSILQGIVRRITYQDKEGRYTVARLETDSFHEVTVVGEIYPIGEGEEIRVNGVWNMHPRYGLQFKADRWERIEPASLEGIENYLSSGLIKGIGPTFAKRLVSAFGLDTLKVLSQEPHRLPEVAGIGRVRAQRILSVWNQHEGMREALVFLQGHGMTSSLALKIYRAYGIETVAKVKENPYRLAREIHGIGFLLADRIAAKFGIQQNSPYRAQAGVLHLLQKAAEEGHCFLPLDTLTRHVCALLNVEEGTPAGAIKKLAAEGEVVLETNETEPFPRVYYHRLHQAECRVAAAIYEILARRSPAFLSHGTQVPPPIQGQPELMLHEEQRAALDRALRHRVAIITGGPGTGKTTLLAHLLALLRSLKISFALAAPTGRAAKRMSEMTGDEAKTIHRLLEYNPRLGGFQRDENNRLRSDFVIIDEVSMVDLSLMDQLLQAIEPRSHLILLGDVDQLPSVGPGNVLRDLIDSRAVPVVTLRHIFRQAGQSLIVVNAHRVLQGLLPLWTHQESRPDFVFIERESPAEILETVKHLVKEEIPRLVGVEPIRAVQVLSPTHRGPLGTTELNQELQNLLNPQPDFLEHGRFRFRVGDRVMQLRNNYEKGVFNGDLGWIAGIDRKEGTLNVRFDADLISYDTDELEQLGLAYATSVHKSQGSEYPVVILPLHTSHYLMLHRSILYTAITRGRQLVVLVGSKKAVAMATKNIRVDRRFTGLKEKLMAHQARS
jgi:exodeoxyribonuclease V alpha subunit